MVRGMESGSEAVAELARTFPQLVRGEQVEQHEDVGLLRGLVGVDRMSFALSRMRSKGWMFRHSEPIGPPRPARLQVLVNLELADDAVSLWTHEHSRSSGARLTSSLGETRASSRTGFRTCRRTGIATRIDQFERPPQHPHRHDVRVGVVVHPCVLRPGIPGVELVGPHHPPDDEAIQTGVASAAQ